METALKKTIEVVAGVISCDGKILLAKRKAEKSLGGYWEFPGGKLEVGESRQNCLKREIKEEMALDIEVKDFICLVEHDYPTFKIKLHVYGAEYISGEISLIDHDEIVWENVNKLREYQLAPADVPVLTFLK